MTQDRATRARAFIAAIPHAVALRMELDAIGEGRCEMSMPWDAHLVGDPATWVIAGGAVSALMDTCAGAAVLSHPEATASTATLGLRIDYMRPAQPGQRIRARAEVYHMTRSVAFVRASATDDDLGRPVAMATGTFTVERPAAASDAPGPETQASRAPASQAPASTTPASRARPPEPSAPAGGSEGAKPKPAPAPGRPPKTPPAGSLS